MGRVSKLSLLTFMCLLTNGGSAFADLDSDLISEISFYATYVENADLPPPQDENQGNYYLFAHTRWSLSSEQFAFELQPEIRSVHSSAELTPEMRITVQSPRRLMSLNTKIASEERQESHLDVERLNATYIHQGAQFTVGRKPFSLGVLSVFPVWNKFSRPLMTEFGPLRVFNQDQVTVRKQQGPWLFQVTNIEMRDPDLATRVGELTWFGEGVEFHGLVGEWRKNGAVGVAAVKDIAGTSIKLEEISFSGDGVQAGLGAEKAFDDQWSGLAEFLYLETGAAHKEDYFSLTQSPFRSLNGRYYGYLRAEYKPSPLWILQFGDLMNFVDHSQLLNTKAIYSAANEVELSFELRIPMGGYDTELSRRFMATEGILAGRADF